MIVFRMGMHVLYAYHIHIINPDCGVTGKIMFVLSIVTVTPFMHALA